MKKYLLAFLFVIASICSLSAQALRDNVKYNNPEEPKSIGIVLYSNVGWRHHGLPNLFQVSSDGWNKDLQGIMYTGFV